MDVRKRVNIYGAILICLISTARKDIEPSTFYGWARLITDSVTRIRITHVEEMQAIVHALDAPPAGLFYDTISIDI